MELTKFSFISDEKGCGHHLMLDGLIVRSEVEMALYHVDLADDPRDSITTKLACFGFAVDAEDNVKLEDARLEAGRQRKSSELTPIDVAFANGLISNDEYKANVNAVKTDDLYLDTLREVLANNLSTIVDCIITGSRDGVSFTSPQFSFSLANEKPKMLVNLANMLDCLVDDSIGTRITHSITMEPFKPIRFEVVST